jgi:PPOX class probable F420-dependent enzyme
MTSPGLPEAVATFLSEANPAVIATLGSEGQPVSVATWYLLEDDQTLLVNMAADRKRLAHIRRDPRVSVTILAARDWSIHVSVQGQASLRDDPNLVDIDKLSQHYTGQPFSDRKRPRVSAQITIQRCHLWGLNQNASSR